MSYSSAFFETFAAMVLVYCNAQCGNLFMIPYTRIPSLQRIGLISSKKTYKKCFCLKRFKDKSNLGPPEIAHLFSLMWHIYIFKSKSNKYLTRSHTGKQHPALTVTLRILWTVGALLGLLSGDKFFFVFISYASLFLISRMFSSSVMISFSFFSNSFLRSPNLKMALYCLK